MHYLALADGGKKHALGSTRSFWFMSQGRYGTGISLTVIVSF